MATRIVEWKKPYTWGKAISIDENKVISLNLRDENNLIIYDEWDDEIYVDLQLDDEITPTDAFPIWVNVGRVIVDNWWDKPWTIISAVTTSGDNIKIFYADEWTLWIDNWTGTFKQIYFKADVDALLLALRNYIDWELAKKQNWVSSDTAPSNPSEWDLWYDTTSSSMKVWDWTAWQSVGWWDVLVSDQANNIFTPWMKIWGGTESDYQSLTPDSNTAYLLLADQPTPPSPWQPWVNTIVYMPIDASDTSSIVYDHSTNWNDFNWHWTANYDTLASWKRVLSFWGSNWIYVDTNLITAQPITMNIWVKRNGTQADSAWVFTSQKQYNGAFMLDWWAFNQWNTLSFVVGGSAIYNKPYNDNTRYNVVGVLDNWEISLYFNGQLQWTQSVTVNLSTDANSFGFTRNNWENMNYRFFNGWMADMIIEDKAWTLQEIQDYFDQTKANYWIS